MAGFKDPLDEEADAAEGRSVSKGADALRDRMRAARETDTEEVVVEDPPEDDEDDEVAEAKEAALTRKEKRAGRMSARERAAAAEAEARVLREQLAQRQPERQDNRPAVNPTLKTLDDKIRDGYKRQEGLFSEYESKRGRLSEREESEYRDRAVELDVELKMLAAERYEVINEPKRRQQAILEQARSEFPDVYSNQQAIDYAHGRFRQLMALGHKDSKELHDQIMVETRQAVLGVRPKPDALQRQRATGITSAAAPGAAPAPVKLSMPKGSPLYRMATAMYPDLDPAAACQKWANKNGKKFAEVSKGHR